MKTEIIFEDKDILVIYKPAGVATQTAKLGQADVVSELKGYLARAEKGAAQPSEKGAGKGKTSGKVGANSQQPYLGIVHRLDQPVEGLLVFGKSKKASADLTAQLQKQGGEMGLHKHYYAVLCGKPSEMEGELVDYMYKSKENMAVIVEKDSNLETPADIKEARLRYKILSEAGEQQEAKDCGQECSLEADLHLADIQILTGRFHQIRAQMAHAGLPLLGDLKYGNENSKELARQRNVRNVALCAYALEFMHPVTKKKMNFEIEPGGIAFSLVKGT